MENVKKKFRWSMHWTVLVVVCLLVGASTGLEMNSVGVFYKPIAADWGIGVGSAALHETLSALFTALSALLVPKWIGSRNFKKVLSGGILAAAAGTWLSGHTESLALLNLLGVLRGIGCGTFGFVACTSIINRWFRRHASIAISIAVSFSGIAGAIGAPILSSAIAKGGWQHGYEVMAYLLIAMCIPALFFRFSGRPEDYGLTRLGENDALSSSVKQETAGGGDRTVMVLLTLSFFLLAALNSFAQYLPALSMEKGISAQAASLTLSFSMIGNIVSKFLYGVLAGRTGIMKTLYFFTGLDILGFALMITGNGIAIMYPAGFLYGIIFSINAVGASLLTLRFFGSEKYAESFRYVNFGITFSVALFNTLIGIAYDILQSYVPIIIGLLIFQAVGDFLLIAAERRFTKAQH